MGAKFFCPLPMSEIFHFPIAPRQIFNYNIYYHHQASHRRRKVGRKMDFIHCKRAELQDPKTKTSIKAAVTIGALDSLLIVVPRDCVLPTNEPITITFLDPVLGVVVCSCKLTSPLVSDDYKFCSYRCQVLKQLKQDQRREDIKISLTAEVEIKLLGSDTYASAVVCNISAGGVYLTTNLAAQKGDRLAFDFKQTGDVIPLTAEVLRVENRPDRYGRMTKGYGCRFVRLSPRYEAQLRSYIFKVAKLSR